MTTVVQADEASAARVRSGNDNSNIDVDAHATMTPPRRQKADEEDNVSRNDDSHNACNTNKDNAAATKAEADTPSRASSLASTATPTATTATMSPEEQLCALQAKMRAWKVAAGTQLREAERKNKLLRDELAAAHSADARARDELRLQLHAEFAERLALQQETVAALEQRVEQLQREQRERDDAHAAALRTAAQVTEQAQAEALRRVRCDAAAHAAHVEQLTERYAELLRAAGANVEEVLSPPAAAAGAQCRDADEGSNEADDEGEDGEDHKYTTTTTAAAAAAVVRVTDTAHRDALAAVQRATCERADAVRSELQMQLVASEQTQQRLTRDVHARDEQLRVQQTLLQQQEQATRAAQQRLAEVQRALSESEQQRVAAVTAAEAAREAAATARAAQDALQTRTSAQLQQLHAQLSQLREEANAREEAFRALVAQHNNNNSNSTDMQAALTQIQSELQTSRKEAAVWRERYTAAAAQQQQQHEQQHEDGSTTAVRVGDEADAQRRRAAALDARAAELATLSTQLSQKAEMLHAAEVRLEEVKRTLAHQARLVLIDGMLHNNNNRNSGSATVGGGGSGAAGRDADDDDDDGDARHATSLLHTQQQQGVQLLQLRRRLRRLLHHTRDTRAALSAHLASWQHALLGSTQLTQGGRHDGAVLVAIAASVVLLLFAFIVLA